MESKSLVYPKFILSSSIILSKHHYHMIDSTINSAADYVSIKLFEYQREDVRKMLFTENNIGQGGINASPTGTGKTIEFIFLIFIDFLYNPSRKTLYICSNQTLANQTEAEFKRIINHPSFKIGNSKESIISIVTKNKLLKNQEFKEIEWYRIVFDEAHKIKNDNSIIRKKLLELKFSKLWLVTATPDINGNKDQESLIRIFTNYPIIMIKNDKEKIFDLLNIPHLNEKIVFLKFLKSEAKIYKEFLEIFHLIDDENSESDSDEYDDEYDADEYDADIDNERKFSHLLWIIYINILRSFCNGVTMKFPRSVNKRILYDNRCYSCSKNNKCLYFYCCNIYSCFSCVIKDNKKSRFYCFRCRKSWIQYIQVLLQHQQYYMNHLSRQYNEEEIRNMIEDHEKRTEGRNIKFLQLAKILEEIKEKKIIIFSERSQVLKKLELFLSNRSDRMKDIKIYRIDGQVTNKKREKILEEFKYNNSSDKDILLITLKTGGEGLNIIEATCAIILEPYWNYGTEKQAIDRIYRIGQTKPTFSYKLYIRGTIEELFIELQNEKRDKKRVRTKEIINYKTLSDIFKRYY